MDSAGAIGRTVLQRCDALHHVIVISSADKAQERRDAMRAIMTEMKEQLMREVVRANAEVSSVAAPLVSPGVADILA
jgi:hypothetical protein